MFDLFYIEIATFSIGYIYLFVYLSIDLFTYLSIHSFICLCIRNH